ncbi:hypothetical protein [Serratia fonticola]
MLRTLGAVLWMALRWLLLSIYHVLVWLFGRRRAALPALKAKPHTFYTSNWLLSDDATACGRSVVVCDAHRYKPGIELIYFGQSASEHLLGDRFYLNEEEATTLAQQMLGRILGQRRTISSHRDEIPES